MTTFQASAGRLTNRGAEKSLRLTRQVLKRSILQMTRQLRQMGESDSRARDLIVSRHTHGKEEPVPEKESNRLSLLHAGKVLKDSMFHGGDCTRGRTF